MKLFWVVLGSSICSVALSCTEEDGDAGGGAGAGNSAEHAGSSGHAGTGANRSGAGGGSGASSGAAGTNPRPDGGAAGQAGEGLAAPHSDEFTTLCVEFCSTDAALLRTMYCEPGTFFQHGVVYGEGGAGGIGAEEAANAVVETEPSCVDQCAASADTPYTPACWQKYTAFVQCQVDIVWTCDQYGWGSNDPICDFPCPL